MKRKLLRIAKIGSAVVCLMLLLHLCGFGHNLIGLWQVDQIELTACDKVGTTTVALQSADVRKFIGCYNLSRYAGEVNAERCDRTFYVCIYLKDGKKIGIVDHDNTRIRITGIGNQSLWADNPILLSAIRNMVDSYDLLWQSWGC